MPRCARAVASNVLHDLGAKEVPKGAIPFLAVPSIHGSVSASACVLLGNRMLSSSVLQAGDAGTMETLVAVRRLLDWSTPVRCHSQASSSTITGHLTGWGVFSGLALTHAGELL